MSQPSLSYVVASVRTGAVLQEGESEPNPEQLQELAATLPEIFGTVELGSLQRIASRLGVEGNAEVLAEVLLLSESRVHVIQPLRGREGEALLASAPASRSVGLILSQVHARAALLEVPE